MPGLFQLDYLERIRAGYPMNLHGVVLPLGAVGRPDPAHLGKLARHVACFQPEFVRARELGAVVRRPSQRSAAATAESLAVLARHVDEVQERLGRCILLENIVAYVRFQGDTLDEPDILSALVARTPST